LLELALSEAAIGSICACPVRSITSVDGRSNVIFIP
jgi:hypothetical protein